MMCELYMIVSPFVPVSWPGVCGWVFGWLGGHGCVVRGVWIGVRLSLYRSFLLSNPFCLSLSIVFKCDSETWMAVSVDFYIGEALQFRREEYLLSIDGGFRFMNVLSTALQTSLTLLHLSLLFCSSHSSIFVMKEYRYIIFDCLHLCICVCLYVCMYGYITNVHMCGHVYV